MGSSESKNQNSTSDENLEESSEVGLGRAGVIAAGVAVLAAGVAAASLLGSSSSSSSDRKTMKAPGRDGRIDRDDFERDPASYFRDLRKN